MDLAFKILFEVCFAALGVIFVGWFVHMAYFGKPHCPKCSRRMNYLTCEAGLDDMVVGYRCPVCRTEVMKA